MEKNDQTIDKKKQDAQLKNKDNTYGFCHWSDDLKIDAKGSNCPEFIFMRIFMKGMFK